MSQIYEGDIVRYDRMYMMGTEKGIEKRGVVERSLDTAYKVSGSYFTTL